MSGVTTTIGYTIGGADDPRNPFHYMPSMAPTIIALVFFTLSFLALLIWTILKRSWYMIVLLVGCVMEIIGYGTRIPLVSQPIGQTGLYICMTSCLIIAPVFYAAIEYLLYGRLVHLVGAQYSFIKPKLIAWVFIISDVLSFFIQVAGAGVLSSAGSDSDKAKLGENILLAGLAVNLASFAIFCFQIFYFDYRTRKVPPPIAGGGLFTKGWRQFLYIIYISSFLVLIRQIYRVIEFAQGFTGYLAVHEVYFYVFDSIPIFLSATIYAICFPANGYLPRNRNNTTIDGENNQVNVKPKHNSNDIIPQNDLVVNQRF